MTKTEHWYFYLVDAAIYLSIFVVLVATLRASLSLIAKHEADESFGKSFVVTLLILLTSATIVTLPQAGRAGLLIALPCVLAGIVFVRVLCWVPIAKASLIMLVFTLVAVGVATGLTKLAGEAMPKGRITLVGRTEMALNILGGIAGQPGESILPSNLFHNVKSGLLLEAGSYGSALALLNDPAAFKQLTTNNAEDLAALGVVMDGKPLTPEQMADLGIVTEDARKGAGVLQTRTATNAVTEDDVRSVVALLKSVRKPGPTVTAADAVYIISEARKRAAQVSTNVLSAALTNSVIDVEAEEAASSSAVCAAESSATSQSLVAAESATGGAAREEVVGVTSRYRNVWLELSPGQQAAWNASRTGLVVGALMASSSGKTLAIVNKALVNTGDVVSVFSAGRSYPWRLVSISVTGVTWRPVMGGQAPDGPAWVTWR